MLDSKDIKDLKYIKEGWKSIDDQGNYYGPQGATPNYTYFTQVQRYQDIANHSWFEDQRQTADPVGWSAEQYQEWEDMHDPNKVMWYDTAACWNTGRIQRSYGHMFFTGDKFATAWSKGTEDLDTGGPNRADAPAGATLVNTYPKGADGTTVNWGTSLSWAGSTIVNTDKAFYTDVLKTHIELIEDCDMDCQKFGSGLSVVAAINQVSLAFILLNFLCMFIGTWRWRARVFSTYCTYVSCFVQFIILIVSGTMLFTPYSMMCSTSLVKTAGDFSWHVADDWYAVTMLWATQWVWMFVFVCAAMCQQYRCPGTSK